MDITNHIGINYNTEYTTEEFDNILSKFNNLSMTDYYIDETFSELLSKQSVSTIIKFINMFRDINEFEFACDDYFYGHSLAGNIIFTIMCKATCDKIYVYKIMDHLLKQGMNVSGVCMKKVHGTKHSIDFFYNGGCYYFTIKEKIGNKDIFVLCDTIILIKILKRYIIQLVEN